MVVFDPAALVDALVPRRAFGETSFAFAVFVLVPFNVVVVQYLELFAVWTLDPELYLLHVRIVHEPPCSRIVFVARRSFLHDLHVAAEAGCAAVESRGRIALGTLA